MQEAIAWAGRVMLHKEVSMTDLPAARQPNQDHMATASELPTAHTIHSMLLAHEWSSTFSESQN